MLDLTFSNLTPILTWLGTAIALLSVLKYKTEAAAVEIKDLKSTKSMLLTEVSELKHKTDTASSEVISLKDTKSKLYNEIGELKTKIVGIERDIVHANSNINECNTRLLSSVTQFQVEMVRSEARIVAHVDTSFAAIKDIVKEALSAKA